MKLTPTRIQKLAWEPSWTGRRKYFPDNEVTGLFVAIESSGSKSYGLRYSIAGKDKRQIYGDVSSYRLDEIREIARLDKQKANKNIDPFMVRRKRAAVIIDKSSTIDGAATKYFASAAYCGLADRTRIKYLGDYERYIRPHEIPVYWNCSNPGRYQWHAGRGVGSV